MLSCEAFVAVKFGSGKKLSIAWPSGVIRFTGILLPGNCAPVSGSVMVIREPLFWKLCEKSPPRSSAVGVYRFCVPPLTNWPVYSCDQKKNNRFLLRLKRCGINTGPPMLYVSTLKRYGEIGDWGV